MSTTPGRQRGDRIIGWSVFGLLIVGVLGVTGSVLTFLGGDRVASAIFLLASGVSFGLLAGALLRQ
jgi:hypothetical protein